MKEKNELLNLNSFLKLGYFLDYKSNFELEEVPIDLDKYKDYKEDQLISYGVKLLLKNIESNFTPNKKHLVPISGGLDSRAILAALLEFTDARNIYTYTFGTPGTLDYEIGNKVAHSIGTNHQHFSLNNYTYKMEELLSISNKVDRQTVLFHHAPVFELERLFGGYLVWSGFMGDPISGSHLSEMQNINITQAKQGFITKNKYVRSIDISNVKDEELYQLIDFKGVENLSTEENLDFWNRQTKFIAPHVLMEGFEYKLPFINSEWMEFMLSIPREYRVKQYLYKKILIKGFPEIFSLPTKTNFGLPLTAPSYQILIKKGKNKILRKLLNFNPNINYIDFNSAIRERKDIRSIVSICLTDLERRSLVDWIDISKILKDHLRGDNNYSDAILVLTSLEIHLKNKDKEYEISKR